MPLPCPNSTEEFKMKRTVEPMYGQMIYQEVVVPIIAALLYLFLFSWFPGETGKRWRKEFWKYRAWRKTQ